MESNQQTRCLAALMAAADPDKEWAGQPPGFAPLTTDINRTALGSRLWKVSACSAHPDAMQTNWWNPHHTLVGCCIYPPAKPFLSFLFPCYYCYYCQTLIEILIGTSTTSKNSEAARHPPDQAQQLMCPSCNAKSSHLRFLVRMHAMRTPEREQGWIEILVLQITTTNTVGYHD